MVWGQLFYPGSQIPDYTPVHVHVKEIVAVSRLRMIPHNHVLAWPCNWWVHQNCSQSVDLIFWSHGHTHTIRVYSIYLHFCNSKMVPVKQNCIKYINVNNIMNCTQYTHHSAIFYGSFGTCKSSQITNNMTCYNLNTVSTSRCGASSQRKHYRLASPLDPGRSAASGRDLEEWMVSPWCSP